MRLSHVGDPTEGHIVVVSNCYIVIHMGSMCQSALSFQEAVIHPSKGKVNTLDVQESRYR